MGLETDPSKGLTREKKEKLRAMIENAPSFKVSLNDVLHWWRDQCRGQTDSKTELK